MRKEYNRLFDKISSSMSDKELLEAALRKAENMSNEAKKISIRKPMIIACAIVAVLACGVTAAAAAGLFSFDALFGNKIVAESEALGYELIGDAHDVVITCSDNRFDVSLNGVTGTANSILANVEISYMDGTPMNALSTEDDNATPSFKDIELTYDGEDAQQKTLSLGYSADYTDTGSVTFMFEISMQREDFSAENGLADRRIMLELDGFGSSKLKDTCDITIEFTYIPSEKALEQLAAADVSAPCDILYNITSFAGEPTELPTGRDIPLETVITAIDIRPTEGMLYGSFDLGAYTWEDYNINTFMCSNDVRLIKQDGTEVPVFLGGYTMHNDDGFASFTMSLEYRLMSEPTETAVDLSTVTAISINGTEYPLA